MSVARRSLLLLAVLGALTTLRLGVLAPPPAAGAAVEHGDGYRGIVDGFRSWYGSYRLAGIGTAWCVDHGIAAPDAALGYEPTDLADHAPETRRAIAWAVGRYGPGADRPTAAALMLVLHDLMGAAYPSGRLSVDTLTADRLAGFEGDEQTVIDRARAIKADAVAHAGVVTPYGLAVDAPAVLAGRSGAMTARLADGAGNGIAGVRLHPAVTGAELDEPVDVDTDGNGQAAWSFTAGAGPNDVSFAVDVPSTDVEAFRPTAAPAQRVVRPALATVAGAASFEGVVPRRLTVVKHGDAEPELPVAGAHFTVAGVETTIGDDGRSQPVELVPGHYTLTETQAPPGYDPAGPWEVDIADQDVTLEVADTASRGHLTIDKVDSVTGAPVSGATFRVERVAGAVVEDPSAPLLPGRYRVTEVTAPPGYRLADAPVEVDVVAGQTALARVADVPVATVAFVKTPPVAGATFEVRPATGAGPVLGSCTTDAGGRCALPDGVAPAATQVCWSETQAPPGWLPADGACLALGGPGSVTTVAVDERPVPLPPPPPEVAVEAAPPLERPAPVPPETTTTTTAAVPTPPSVPELPRTGSPAAFEAAAGLALCGLGLLLLAVRW